mgnify:CR=1 FL=1
MSDWSRVKWSEAQQVLRQAGEEPGADDDGVKMCAHPASATVMATAATTVTASSVSAAGRSLPKTAAS